jgi:hypothetical protein
LDVKIRFEGLPSPASRDGQIPEGPERYKAQKNRASIDGLEGLPGVRD